MTELAPLLIVLAVWGIVVQTINIRWLLFARQTVKESSISTPQQSIILGGYFYVNTLRTLVVWANLAIGILYQLTPPRPHFLVVLISHYQGAIATILGIVFVTVFLINELGWDVIITVEIINRRRLRHLGGRL
jgi:hypothetical protein